MKEFDPENILNDITGKEVCLAKLKKLTKEELIHTFKYGISTEWLEAFILATISRVDKGKEDENIYCDLCPSIRGKLS